MKHHENEVHKVTETILAMSNPFETQSNDLVNIASGEVAGAAVQGDMLRAKEIGEKKCVEFMNQKLMSGSPDIFTTIPSSKLKTFSQKKMSTVKTSSGKVVELKNDVKFISRLLAVGKSREIDIKELMTYSLRKFPATLTSSDGQLAKTSKSTLMHLLEDRISSPPVESWPLNNVLVLDAMAIIQTIKNVPETFGTLVEELLRRIISHALGGKSTRIDFVCDRYPDVSIKNLERNKRAVGGSTVIKILGPKQRVPKQFKKFLAVGRNKEALVEFIFLHATQMANLNEILQGITLYVTHGKYCHKFVPALQDEVVIEEVHELYCDHEEADTRLLLHAFHASLSQESVVIKSPDTDVLILMVGHKHAVAADLYFDTGIGNSRRIISIQSIYESLGPDLSAALISFHAFTGKIKVASTVTMLADTIKSNHSYC